MTDRGTPCESSSTVSLSGKRVPARRVRRSSSSASGMSIVNGRIVVSPADLSVMTAMVVLLVGDGGVVTGRACAVRLLVAPVEPPGFPTGVGPRGRLGRAQHAAQHRLGYHDAGIARPSTRQAEGTEQRTSVARPVG